MLASQAKALSAVALLTPGEKANTAGATGSWVEVTQYEGPITFVMQVGAVTEGTITGKIETAINGSGDSPADAVSFVAADGAGLQSAVVQANALKAYVRFVGTIATGPANASCVMLARPKTV